MKKIIAGALLTLLLIPGAAFAQVNTPTTTVEELRIQLIALLTEQLNILLAQLADLKAEQAEQKKETKRIADKVDRVEEDEVPTGGEDSDEEMEIEASYEKPRNQGQNSEGYYVYVFKNVRVKVEGADDGERIYYPASNGFSANGDEVITMDCGGGKGANGFKEGNGKGCYTTGNSSVNLEVEVWTKDSEEPELDRFYYYVNSPSESRESVSLDAR